MSPEVDSTLIHPVLLFSATRGFTHEHERKYWKIYKLIYRFLVGIDMDHVHVPVLYTVELESLSNQHCKVDWSFLSSFSTCTSYFFSAPAPPTVTPSVRSMPSAWLLHVGFPEFPFNLPSSRAILPCMGVKVQRKGNSPALTALCVKWWKRKEGEKGALNE